MTSREAKLNPTNNPCHMISAPMPQKLITRAICQPRLIARQTNVAKGETLSVMDSSVPNEMLLL